MFMKLVRKDHIYVTEIAHKELKKKYPIGNEKLGG